MKKTCAAFLRNDSVTELHNTVLIKKNPEYAELIH